MNRKLGLLTLLYGLLLASAGAAAAALKLDPANKLALYAGIGGGLCILWGVLGAIGFKSVLGAGVTLGATGFWLLSKAVIGWLNIVSAKAASLPLTLATTVLLGFAIALLVAIMPKDEGAQASSGNSAASGSRQAGAGKRSAT